MINNRITANEARAFIDGNWKSKLEEIYNGVRAVIETGAMIKNFGKILSVDIGRKVLGESCGYMQISW